MIVTCPACQTRFRVPDEKSSPKGARFRCGRCGAISMISPPPAPPHELSKAPPPIAENPLAKQETPRGRLEVPPGDPFAPRELSAVGRQSPPPVPPPRQEPSPAPPPEVDPFGPFADERPASFDPGEPSPATEPVPSPLPEAGRRGLTDLLGPAMRSTRPRVDGATISLEEGDRRVPVTAVPDPALGAREGGDDAPSIPSPAPHPADAAPGTPLEDSGLELAYTPGDPSVGRLGDAPVHLEERPPERPPRAPPPPVQIEPIAVISGPGPVLKGPSPPVPVTTPPITPARWLAVVGNGLSLAILIGVAAAMWATWRGDLPFRPAMLPNPAPDGIEVTGVTGGDYDTSSGTRVLVVRGAVRPRTGVPGPVRVQAEVLLHGKIIGTIEGLAGATALPEQVFDLTSPEGAVALRTDLDKRSLQSLAAGEAVPFILFAYPPPAETGEVELRVTAGPAPGPRG